MKSCDSLITSLGNDLNLTLKATPKSTRMWRQRCLQASCECSTKCCPALATSLIWSASIVWSRQSVMKMPAKFGVWEKSHRLVLCEDCLLEKVQLGGNLVEASVSAVKATLSLKGSNKGFRRCSSKCQTCVSKRIWIESMYVTVAAKIGQS